MELMGGLKADLEKARVKIAGLEDIVGKQVESIEELSEKEADTEEKCAEIKALYDDLLQNTDVLHEENEVLKDKN